MAIALSFHRDEQPQATPGAEPAVLEPLRLVYLDDGEGFRPRSMWRRTGQESGVDRDRVVELGPTVPHAHEPTSLEALHEEFQRRTTRAAILEAAHGAGSPCSVFIDLDVGDWLSGSGDSRRTGTSGSAWPDHSFS